MILILSAVTGVIAFAGEFVFTRTLKQGGTESAVGVPYIKAVLYPFLAVSASLWGSMYFGRDGEIVLQLLVCAGVLLVLFLLELFVLKNRVSAFAVAAFLLQSVAAVFVSFYLGEKSDILKYAVAYASAALLPVIANTAVYALKTKVRESKCGLFIYIVANLLAPVAACIAFMSVMSEVFLNVPAL